MMSKEEVAVAIAKENTEVEKSEKVWIFCCLN